MALTRDEIPACRLRMRSDVLVLPALAGAQIHRGEEVHAIEGRGVFELLMRMGEHLDGSRSVSEICAGLSDDRRRLVYDLCAWLAARDLAIAIAWDGTEYISVTGTPTLAFWVAERTDGSLSRFQDFQRSRVLIAGEGVLPLACVNALSSLGLRRVDVLAGTPHRERMSEILALRGGDVTLEEVFGISDAEYDAVLNCSVSNSSANLGRAELTCNEQGSLLVSLSLATPAESTQPSTTAAACLADYTALAILYRQARVPEALPENSVITICTTTLVRTVRQMSEHQP